MADRDNNIIIGTDLDSRPAIKSLNDLKRTIKGAFSKNDVSSQFNDVTKELSDAKKYAEKLSTEINAIKSGQKEPASIKAIQKELTAAEKEAAKLDKEFDKIMLNPKVAAEFEKITEKQETSQKRIKALKKEISELSTGEKSREQAQDDAERQAYLVTHLKQTIAELEKYEATQERITRIEEKYNAALTRTTQLQENASAIKASGGQISPEQQAEITSANRSVRAYEQQLTKLKDVYESLISYRSTLNTVENEGIDYTAKRIAHLTDLLNAEEKQLAELVGAEHNLTADTESNLISVNERIAELRTQLGTANAVEISELQGKLNSVNGTIQDLTKQSKKLEKQSRKSHGLSTAFENARLHGERLIGMMKRMTIRLLFYQTFGKAIRSTVDYIKQAVAADNELSRSAAILKGNILTAFQQIYTVLRPIIMAIIGLLNLLTGIFNRFMSLLTGKSVKASQAAAKSMYNLSKATGSAGKEAKKTLASFDELIQIGDKSEDASGGAPAATAPEFIDPEQFKLSDNMREALKAIAGLLLYILGIILLIKGAIIVIPGIVGLIRKLVAGFGSNGPLATIAGLMLVIGGWLILIQEYSDAWINGLDWDNFSTVLTGLAMIVAGLVLMFGQAVLPIALIGAGLAAIVLAVHDMIKQGPTLKNQLMLFIGLITTVIGLLMSGHATLGLIIAIIGAAILIAGNFGEQWSNIMEHCGQIVDGFVKLVKDLINGDFEAAWEDAKQIVKGFANLGIDIFEGLVKAAAKAVNKIIDAINSINVTIPDWVPGIGGKSFSPNLKKISTEWSLPRFAQGAVIPPNKEFMAVLGDQKHGTNIETPLETMIQAFNAALDGRDNSQNININFTGSLAEVARLLKPQIDNETTRQGKRSSNGLIVGGNY